MDLVLRIGTVVFIVILAPWFWAHCARPCLIAMGARPAAKRLAFGLSIAVVLAALIDLVSWLAAQEAWDVVRPIALAVSATYVVVVALGYLNDYTLLIRATGGSSGSPLGPTTERV